MTKPNDPMRGPPPRPEAVKPRSARDLGGAPEVPTPPAAAEPERVRFEANGASWTAQSMGGSIGPKGTAPAPLLLVRFTRDVQGDRGDRGGPPGEAEAWIPARSLSDLSSEQLVDALGRARPWPEPGARPGFFGDIGGQRRR